MDEIDRAQFDRFLFFFFPLIDITMSKNRYYDVARRRRCSIDSFSSWKPTAAPPIRDADHFFISANDR